MKHFQISRNSIFTFFTLIFFGILPSYAQQDTAVGSVSSDQVSSARFVGNDTTFKPQPYSAKRSKSAPVPTGTHDWTGFYIGGQVGYGWGNGDTDFDPLPDATTFINLQPQTLDVKPRGVLAGGQVGYNWQSGHFVIGGEANFAWADVKKTKTVTPIIQNNGTPFPGAGFLSASQDISFVGNVRPRVGGAWGNVLVYGTAGLAFARIDYFATSDFRPVGTTQYPVSFSKTRTGWVAGGGVEVAVSSNVSVRGEYLYSDFGHISSTANPTPALPPFQVMYTWHTKLNTFTGGVNFHF